MQALGASRQQQRHAGICKPASPCLSTEPAHKCCCVGGGGSGRRRGWGGCKSVCCSGRLVLRCSAAEVARVHRTRSKQAMHSILQPKPLSTALLTSAVALAAAVAAAAAGAGAGVGAGASAAAAVWSCGGAQRKPLTGGFSTPCKVQPATRLRPTGPRLGPRRTSSVALSVSFLVTFVPAGATEITSSVALATPPWVA